MKMIKILMTLSLMAVFAGCIKQPKVESLKQPGGAEPNKENVFSTIKEAVTKQIAIGCDYTDPEDQEQTKIYFKGSLIGIRAGENSKQKDVAGLIKDNKIYFWSLSGSSSEGMLIDLSKVTDDSNVKVAGQKVRSNEDIITALEPHRQNCKPVSDMSVFELPSNITFKGDAGFLGDK